MHNLLNFVEFEQERGEKTETISEHFYFNELQDFFCQTHLKNIETTTNKIDNRSLIWKK